MTASGYDTIYRNLASRVKVVEETCSSLSLEVVHARHRKEGSTVLAVHDPACRTQKLLSKRNHKCTFLYNLHPLDETTCQYGWCLSFTPHCLRELDGATALDVFVRDLKGLRAGAVQASNSHCLHLSKGGAGGAVAVLIPVGAGARTGGLADFAAAVHAVKNYDAGVGDFHTGSRRGRRSCSTCWLFALHAPLGGRALARLSWSCFRRDRGGFPVSRNVEHRRASESRVQLLASAETSAVATVTPALRR